MNQHTLSRQQIHQLCQAYQHDVSEALLTTPTPDTDDNTPHNRHERAVIQQAILRNPLPLPNGLGDHTTLLERMTDFFTGQDILSMTEEELDADIRAEGRDPKIEAKRNRTMMNRILRHIRQHHRGQFSSCSICHGTQALPTVPPPARRSGRLRFPIWLAVSLFAPSKDRAHLPSAFLSVRALIRLIGRFE
ncbi:MAG: hypothetical protein HOP00_12140, partial [Nitrospira sp.]|nr:hypothetical protein [Nitrospira sp.]